MNNQKMKCNLMLVLTAFIWGCAFVAQSAGMEFVGPFTFNAVRNFLGGIVLLPVIAWFGRNETKIEKKEQKTEQKTAQKTESRQLLIGGACCGCALFVASSLQQVGMTETSAGKAGFITALYILIVPILGLFLGKKIGAKIWIGVALAVVGMYCLCVTESFSISRGDFLVFLCAVVFSIHIMVIDYFSPKVNGVKMASIQFFVCGLLSSVPMLILEHPQMDQILTAWLPIGYAGIFSCGVAYTMQILGQKHTDPTVASLLMSLESVFAVLSGWVLLHERLSAKELTGCLLVFTAIILAQLPSKAEFLQAKKEGRAEQE